MVMVSNSPLSQKPEEIIDDKDDISYIDLIGVVIENLRLLVIGPLMAGLLGYCVALWLMTPIFTAKTTVIPPGQTNSNNSATSLLSQLGGLSSLAGGASGFRPGNDQYIAYLRSNTLSDQLVNKFKLMERFQVKYQEQAREALKARTNISADKKTGLILIEVSDADPQFAANLANAYVGALSQMLGKMALEDAKARRQLLEQQLNEATEKSYRSPLVRESIIQSVVREYETAVLDQKKDGPFIQQVDIAEVPEFKSKPIRSRIAILSAITTGFVLLFLVFFRNALRNAQQDPETKERLHGLVNKLYKQLPW